MTAHRLKQAVVSLLAVGVACATIREVRLSPQSLCDQGTVGLLIVKVTDEQGTYLPGATVSLQDSSGTLVGRGMAGADGTATFQQLPGNGVCGIRAELTGFEVTTAKPFPCLPACRTTVSLPMRVDTRNAVTFT